MDVEPPPDYLLKRDQQFIWTEARAQKALINCFNVHQHHAFPNVMLGAGEMDLAVLSPSSYLTEIEIKVSARDWNNDKHKDKWLPKHAAARQVVKYFCYAVPVELMNAMPEDIDPNAGIISLFWDYTVRGQNAPARAKRWKVWGQWAKQPKAIKGATPITNETYQTLLLSMYHRYWRQLYEMSALDERLLPMPDGEEPAP